MKLRNRKGFTLIELLVVIAIIAVLSVVVILSLNPAELLRQARDSNRISDMATLKSAISLYLADVSTPSIGTTGVAEFSDAQTSTVTTIANMTSVWGIATAASSTALATTTRTIAGAGWIPVNFSNISSGAPIGALPVDPVNASSASAGAGMTGLFYGYIPNTASTTFKLVTHTESNKYSQGGSADIESTDGGLSTTTYEQGTNLNL